jgi:hypothetical protein
MARLCINHNKPGVPTDLPHFAKSFDRPDVSMAHKNADTRDRECVRLLAALAFCMFWRPIVATWTITSS